MLYSTQPVYSFSGKNKDPKNWTEVPGPGNYQHSTQFEKAKGYSFGGGPPRNKRGSFNKGSPGPGEYTVEKNSIEVKQKAPSFGFGSQKRTKDLTDTPLGPGSYKTNSSFDNALVKRDFKQTARRDCLDRRGDKDPGPGSYSPDTSRTKLSAPKFGFGSDQKQKQTGKNPNPSPDQYKINDSLTKTTHSSWGMGYGEKIDLSKTLAETPGPGSYQSPSYTTDGKKYQMGARKNMFVLKEDKIPGPGAYQPDHEKGKIKAPQYGFGSDQKLKTAGKASIPNPQSYEIKDSTMRKTNPSWGMGYGQKIDLSKTLAETPGPGSYEYKTSTTDGKKYGIGDRKNMFNLEKEKNAPGPGAYSIDELKNKSKAPQYKFGTDSKIKEAGKRQMPDPQSYNIKDNMMHKTASSWGMGYGQKIDLAKTLANTPGPGSYETKSHIADGK